MHILSQHSMWMHILIDACICMWLISEHWSWNPRNSLQSTFRSNLHELRNPFWVDYYLAYLTMTNFYDQPMFESGNICDLGLLQNARTHGPRGTVKTIEKPILHMTQVHYFCSGNSNEDGETIIGNRPTYMLLGKKTRIFMEEMCLNKLWWTCLLKHILDASSWKTKSMNISKILETLITSTSLQDGAWGHHGHMRQCLPVKGWALTTQNDYTWIEGTSKVVCKKYIR